MSNVGEVKRTNFSLLANLYVNTHRKLIVEPEFKKKEVAKEAGNKKQTEHHDLKARLKLREVIRHANSIPITPDNPEMGRDWDGKSK